MGRPKVGVVVFPGSLDDRDAARALHLSGMEPVLLWHAERDLAGVDAVVLPGGFSYGDYLRAGAIARFAPVMEKVAEFAQAGHPVLGICNGFQILCEAGLLPGALARNSSLRFICREVWVRVEEETPFTTGLKGRVLRLPIKHSQGRYLPPGGSEESLAGVGKVIFRYADSLGEARPEVNPNGSVGNIAGVASAAGNVVGLMPHPEHAADPELGRTDGLPIFSSLLAHLEGKAPLAEAALPR